MIFNLEIDDKTMRRRLLGRTNNDFGKKPEEIQLMIELNRTGDKPAGAIDINANQELNQVVDEILDYCGLTASVLPLVRSRAMDESEVSRDLA